MGGNSWREVTIKSVLADKGYIRGPFGSALRRMELSSSGVPVYEQQNAIYDHREFRFFVGQEKYSELLRFTVREDDLIISCSGTLGKVSIIKPGDAKGIISQALLILRPNPDVILPEYLKYFLLSPQGYNSLVSVSSGSVQVNIAARGIIENIRFVLPPLPEQRRIAHTLGTLDDKIKLNRRINTTLEATAGALFKSWFVDFDPVRARLEERPSGLPAEIEALFPNGFEDSELGKIPKGWEVDGLSGTFNITMGQSPPGSTYNEKGVGLPFFQGRRDFSSRFPNKRIHCSEPKRLAEAGDTLVSVRAPVGDINMALERSCIGRGIAGIRHKSGSRSFTYYSLQSLHRQLSGFEGEGTVFGSITKDGFNTIPFVKPPETLVQKFEDIVMPNDELILASHLETQTLTTLRDLLLPRLVRGT